MSKGLRDELYNFGLYRNQLADLLLWHFESTEDAAKFFGVTVQTLKRWCKTGNWPMSAARLLLIIHRGYMPVSKEWRGFKIRGDRLITPGGREITAHDLMELDIKVSLKNTSNIVQFRRKKKNRLKCRQLKKQGISRPVSRS